MEHLPIELVGVVINNISSPSDLLSLRSVSSTYHQLVTPQVFQRIHIRNSIESARCCRSILDSPSLSAHVREVVYDQRDDARFSLLPVSAQGNVCRGTVLRKRLIGTLPTGACDELEIAELEDILTDTFCSLSGFAHLESVALNFWPSFHSRCGFEIHEHPFWFTNRQIAVLHAVHHAMKTSCVRSLTLNNVILISSACYDFVSSGTSSSLYHLSMSVVANSELGAWSGSKALNGSLSSLLPAPNANLQSLVLRSPQGLYHSLNTQLRSSNYPALETLVLENIVFDPTPSADGMEEFIVRHRASLRRLELRSCSSYVPSIIAPVRRWSAIWKRLGEELAHLTEIVVDNNRQGYALLDGTRGYVPHPSLPAEICEEDEEVFLQFRDRVTLRSILSKT